MERGPVQVVVVGFGGEDFAGEVLPELRRLRGGTMIRLLDVILVSKDEDGCMTTMNVHHVADGEWSEFGETIGALIGFGAHCEAGLPVGADAGAADGGRDRDASEAWAISDAIPAGCNAAVALIEHPWAIPLRGAVTRGGFALEDTWLHPADPIAVGALTSDEVCERGLKTSVTCVRRTAMHI